MRDLVRLVVGTVIVFAASPALAQRYDPAYPVCMELNDENGTRMECMFTTMQQCKEGAKSMPGTCLNNPYYKPPPPEATPVAEPAPTPSPTPAKKKKK